MSNPDQMIRELLNGFSARDLFDELCRRGVLDYMDHKHVIDGAMFRRYPEDRHEQLILESTRQQVHHLAVWMAENGVITTVVQANDVETDPEELPPLIRDMSPGTRLLTSGLFTRVPGRSLDDR